MTHLEIVQKLIGNIDPVGCSNRDEKRFENLKEMCELVENLVVEIQWVANRNKDAYESSVKRSGEYAYKFLFDNLGIREY